MKEIIIKDCYTKVNKVNTHYWSAGEEGSVVIFLHGVGCTVEFWEKNIAELAQNHRVYALDIVGFGKTDKPDMVYSFEAMANFVLAFMDELKIDKASLIGNSMGGGISIVLASLKPERIEKVILVSPAGVEKEVSFILRLMTLPLLKNILTAPSKEGIVRQMSLSLYDSSQVDDDFISRVADINIANNNQQAFISMINETANIFGFRQEVLTNMLSCLKNINLPVLVIWGKQDKILSFEKGKKAIIEMPNIKFFEMDKAGHFPQIDKPKEFNKVVEDFLLNN